MSAVAGRSRVLALEEAMLSLPAEHRVSIEPVHYFADGVYAREITIPAGVTIAGKIHKTDHVCIVSAGECLVYDGGPRARRVCAPATFVAPAGSKRAISAITETVWTVFHPTHETDLDRIQAQFIARDEAELERCGAAGEAWVLETKGPQCLG